MKILIIGYGIVGKAMAELLTKRYDVDVYDPKMPPGLTINLSGKHSSFIPHDALAQVNYDLVVICVPTDMKENGECDISIVEESIQRTNGKLYLIKSTVTPGTTDKLIDQTKKNIVFSPEYVGESKYYNSYFPNSMVETPMLVLGGTKTDTSKIIDILLPILGPDKQYYQLSAIESEIVKYMENTFFATKITYCQEMYDLCEKVGADWNSVREAWLSDPRINPMHTAVFRNDRGFGGKCLPKDTNALAFYMKQRGLKPIILDAVLEKNNQLRDGTGKTEMTGDS